MVLTSGSNWLLHVPLFASADNVNDDDADLLRIEKKTIREPKSDTMGIKMVNATKMCTHNWVFMCFLLAFVAGLWITHSGFKGVIFMSYTMAAAFVKQRNENAIHLPSARKIYGPASGSSAKHRFIYPMREKNFPRKRKLHHQEQMLFVLLLR